MQKHVNLKHVTLLLGLLLTAVWCGAREIGLKDGFSNINIKEGNVQGVPRGSSIQASIDGHNLKGIIIMFIMPMLFIAISYGLVQILLK